MDRRTFLSLAAAGMIATARIPALAHPSDLVMTTWVPKEFQCPVCKTENTFQVWASYGSYIYQWPSKYQWVFWPWTDSPSVYLCKKCHLATFLGDFDKLPNEKLPLIRTALGKLPFDRKFKDYLEVPISERLEIAKVVYQSLPDYTDGFWNHFYRVQGFHFGQDGNVQKAAEARTKALELTQKMIADPKTTTAMKELLYISGAMKHYLKNDKSALEDFNKGLVTKFADPSVKADELRDAEDGMNERLKDYIQRIRSEKPPRSVDA